MENGESTLNLTQSTNLYKNYNIVYEENSSKKNSVAVLAVGLTLIIFNQSVVNLSTSINRAAEASTKHIETLLENNSKTIYRSNSTLVDSFTVSEEGVETMNTDVRQKDIDNLEEKTEIKLETINTKIEHIDYNIEDLKETLKRLEDKLDRKPSKDYLESQISKSTNKFLLWAGAGITVVIGFIYWYLPLIINAQ